MREAEQAPGSRESRGAQTRVLLIVTHHLLWGPGGDAQRTFGEAGGEPDALAGGSPAALTPGNVHEADTTVLAQYNFRHHQAEGQKGHLQQGSATRVSAGVPLWATKDAHRCFLFSLTAGFNIRGKGGQRGQAA